VASLWTVAAVCRRGHWISFDIREQNSDFCAGCGAAVMNACDSCGANIRGVEIDPPVLVIGGESSPPPRFCEGCGAPFPWLDRQGRIYELQNMLQREGLDPADELYVREQLDALADPDLSKEQQQERWARVKKRAPGVVAAGGRIIETLASAAARSQLGI
jgi:hypothetical protein